MRELADSARIEQFMHELGRAVELRKIELRTCPLQLPLRPSEYEWDDRADAHLVLGVSVGKMPAHDPLL